MANQVLSSASSNRSAKKPTRFITHFESAIDGTKLPANEIQTMHDGKPLWSRYDLDAVKAVLTKEVISADERVVIFNTAAGQKYFGQGGAIEGVPSIDLNQPTDWEQFESDY